MADCGAAGSALDRTVSALASATLGAAGSAHGGSSQQAVAAAGKAVASLLGMTAATAGGAMSAGSMVGGGGGLMPAAPPDRLYLPGHRHQQQQQQQPHPPAAVVPPQHASHQHHARMDEAWNGNSSAMMHPAAAHAHAQVLPRGPMHHPMMAHPSHPHEAAMAHAHAQQAQHQMSMQMNMMMMHQQQQQMMHQQQQQQQQQQLAAQKQAQMMDANQTASRAQTKNRTRQRSPAAVAVAEPSVTSPALDTAAESWHDGLEEDFATNMRQYRSAEDDDVKTVGEGDEENDEANVGHEGYVEGASIDQLAAAWAQAEEEAGAEARRQQESDYRAQYGEDFAYDPADMAAAYADPASSAAAELDAEEMGMAQYEFSDLSAPHPDEDALRRTNYFDEGMKHFDAGNMAEAIRAFETELRHVDADNSDAWRMLGRCHAENDQDRKAIACLERAVDRDPYSVEALLLLGTSYVNELDHPRALRNLKSWATHNPTYAGMKLPSVDGAASASASSPPEERERTALEEAKKLLEKAIEVDPTQAADAMEALGVVCNVSREYDAAIDHFRKAIDLRPDDYQLHNKLGATLANSNRSDEALPAYHKALQLKPKYARAWLNMAISHANLHNYDEAARCYLQTLSLNPGATHVWSYLRIALTCAERWDLLPLAASQNLAGFKEHFDFVQY